MNTAVKDVINIDVSTNDYVIGNDVVTSNRFGPLNGEVSESNNASSTPDDEDKCIRNEDTCSSVSRLPNSAARHNNQSPEV